MSENKVKWHPYPKEKPKKEGLYLVTQRILIKKKWEDDSFIVKSSNYHLSDGFFLDNWAVTAWAELPEPYKESEAE